MKAGLLGFYIELYDRVAPTARSRIDDFYQTIASELEKRGIDIIRAPICRVKNEFENAIASFSEASAIITLHLAYSPSLESADALAKTNLPIIILDTTPTYSYAPNQNPDELMYNHGIHGVQDLCNLLLRKGKRFQIEAGHWEKSDVLDRAVKWVKASAMAKRFKTARIGKLGPDFEGMGDFVCNTASLGITTVNADLVVPNDDDPELEKGLDIATAKACLAVRRWLEKERLDGWTMNFENASPLPSVPFLEASRAMSRGIGYAGEGDVLTAALVSVLLSVFPETSFTEMFCPDWEHDRIFLSHMGEINLRVCDGEPKLMKKDLPFLAGEPPVMAIGRFKSGEALLVNLAPTDEGYTLILAPVELPEINEPDKMEDAVRGWIKPKQPISDFLTAYSRLGGTHHSALTYTTDLQLIRHFGELMNWKVEVVS